MLKKLERLVLWIVLPFMDGYMLLQHAVSQGGWQRQPERECVRAWIATAAWRNALEKAVLQVRQRWAGGTALGLWRGRVQAPGNPICWSLSRRKGHQVCSQVWEAVLWPSCPWCCWPRERSLGEPSCADLMWFARSGCTLDAFSWRVSSKCTLCPHPGSTDLTSSSHRNWTMDDGWSWEGHLECLGCCTHRS